MTEEKKKSTTTGEKKSKAAGKKAAGGKKDTKPQFAKGGRGKTIGARFEQNWKAIEARFSKEAKPMGRPPKWDPELVATNLREYVDMMPFPDVPMLPEFLNRYKLPRRTYYELLEKSEDLSHTHTYLQNACQTRLIQGALYEIFPHGAVRAALQSLGMAGSSEAQDIGKGIGEGMSLGLADLMLKWDEQDRKEKQKKRMSKKTEKTGGSG